jgi:hypothetical protein
MLADYFKIIYESAACISSRETFKEVNLEYKIHEYNWDILSGLVNNLREIPKRDKFELTVDINGSVKSITTTESIDVHLVKDFFDSEISDEIKIDLVIYKEAINEVISVYFIKVLEGYIKSTSINNLLISFGRFFQGKLHFEVFEEISSFRSQSVSFDTNGSFSAVDEVYRRTSKLSEIKENACKIFDDCEFLIDDFFLIKRNSNYQELMNFFDSVAILLALSTFSNVLSLNEKNEVSFKINGYKTIDVKNINLNRLPYEMSLLHKISSWIFESGQCSDKLGLIRNIMSLHVDNSGLVEINKYTWLAIQSNYEIYLKDNIHQYIEIKNKLTDYIFSYNTKIYELSDQFQNSFRSNLVALIGFIISVVVVNGFKDSGVKTIFSGEYLYIVVAISCISALWMWFSKQDLVYRSINSEKNIRSVLSRNYQNVLMKDEIDSYIDPAFSESKVYLNQQLDKYICWWSIILLIFTSVFILGYFIFSNNGGAKDVKESLIKTDQYINMIIMGPFGTNAVVEDKSVEIDAKTRVELTPSVKSLLDTDKNSIVNPIKNSVTPPSAIIKR